MPAHEDTKNELIHRPKRSKRASPNPRETTPPMPLFSPLLVKKVADLFFIREKYPNFVLAFSIFERRHLPL